MSEQPLQHDQVHDEIYLFKSKAVVRLIFISVLALIIAFVWNLPIKSLAKAKIETLIAKNKQCKLTYQNFDIGFGLLSYAFDQAQVAGRCLPPGSPPLFFDTLNARLHSPRSLALGARFKVEAKSDRTRILAYPAVGALSNSLKIEESTIHMDTIAPFLKLPVTLKGSIDVECLCSRQFSKSRRAFLVAQSRNLGTEGLSFFGINVPPVQIGNLALKAELNERNLLVQDFILGDENSGVQGDFKGEINMNFKNIKASQLNLEGRLRIGDSITKRLPIVNSFFGNYAKDREFYLIKLSGSLGPKTSSRKKVAHPSQRYVILFILHCS